MSETIGAMADRSSVAKNPAQVTRRKAGTIRKVKNEQGAPAPSAGQATEAQAATKIGDLPVRSHLRKGHIGASGSTRGTALSGFRPSCSGGLPGRFESSPDRRMGRPAICRPQGDRTGLN